MSTAVDAAFEELVTGPDAGGPAHGVCAVCYPTSVPAGGIAYCGYRFPAEEFVIDGTGLHKCARCMTTRRPPCGHL